MDIITRVLEKIGSGGAIVAAMGCAACFPALGAFGAAIGLGFLSSYEGLFLNKLLPLFAGLALLANLVGWFQHRVHYRGIISVLGPMGVLLSLYPLWKFDWSTYLFYVGLVLMLTVSLVDVVKPAKTPACESGR
jgi:mercuric ion transport protein